MTSECDIKTTHKEKSSQDDIDMSVSCLDRAQTWQFTAGRNLNSFPKIKKSPYDFDTENLHTNIMNTVERLKRNCVDLTQESDEEATDTESEMW